MADAAAAVLEDEEEWEHVPVHSPQRPEERSTAFPAGAHERRRLRPHSCPRHLGGEEEEEEEEERGWIRWMLSGSAWRSIRSGIETSYTRIPAALGRRPGGGGGCSLPMAAVAVLMGFLMYQRRRHRREKELFVLLNKTKDKRIRELLEQIVLMNNTIAARRRVPVLVRG